MIELRGRNWFGWPFNRPRLAPISLLVSAAVAFSAPASSADLAKRGIGLATREPTYEKIACLAEGRWYYDWTLTPLDIKYNLRFVPMVRGQGDLSRLLQAPPARPYDTLLMFNEPNRGPKAKNYSASLQASTDDLDRDTAQLAQYTKFLVGPSPVRSFLPWFKQYMASGEAGRDLGAVAIHWYGPADFGVFKTYIDQTISSYGKPIWLTEFGVTDRERTFTQADTVNFLNQALPYLDNNPMVQRYAWFGLHGNDSGPYKDSGFFDPSGRLTIVGDRYLLSSLSPGERASRLARCGVLAP